MVEVVDKRGRVAKVSKALAAGLVKLGRFEYRTTAITETPEVPVVAKRPKNEKVEGDEPKKRGRPKKVKDAE